MKQSMARNLIGTLLFVPAAFLLTPVQAAGPQKSSPDDQYKKLTPDSEEQPGVQGNGHGI